VLDNWELGQNFGVEHLDHALVNLAPTISNTRDIKENGTVLPKWALLNVVDEANGRKVHIDLSLVLHDSGFGNVTRLRRTFGRPLQRHWFVIVYGSCELRRAEYVGHEGVVVEAPDAVGTSGFESVG
jgi:hypothetical protein